MYEEVRSAARAALLELLDAAALKPGQQVVIGCSSSEIMGQKIGKGSTPEAAKAVVDEILPILNERGLCLEAQCCEHLNRALVVERACAERYDLPDIEALVVGHHGSRYSSTDAFLQQVRPETAIISVGDNSYGHPTQEAMDRLSRNGAAVYRTDRQGNILVTVNGGT